MKRNIIGGNPSRGRRKQSTTGMLEYYEWKARERKAKEEKTNNKESK